MAEFLTTKGVSHHIENIIIEAKHQLYLVSPYLQISKTFLERLRDASRKGIYIKIIYGKDELNSNERNQLIELKNIELFFFENLHAKCYFNESRMVITSMNMYQFSEINNREMGILIDSILDKELFEKAKNETISILQSSESRQNNNNKINWKTNNNNHGFCIRCSTHINLNPSQPYCRDCYYTWSQFGNLNYEENVCHKCGQSATTSMNTPLDYYCYLDWKKTF